MQFPAGQFCKYWTNYKTGSHLTSLLTLHTDTSDHSLQKTTCHLPTTTTTTTTTLTTKEYQKLSNKIPAFTPLLLFIYPRLSQIFSLLSLNSQINTKQCSFFLPSFLSSLNCLHSQLNFRPRTIPHCTVFIKITSTFTFSSSFFILFLFKVTLSFFISLTQPLSLSFQEVHKNTLYFFPPPPSCLDSSCQFYFYLEK